MLHFARTYRLEHQVSCSPSSGCHGTAEGAITRCTPRAAGNTQRQCHNMSQSIQIDMRLDMSSLAVTKCFAYVVSGKNQPSFILCQCLVFGCIWHHPNFGPSCFHIEERVELLNKCDTTNGSSTLASGWKVWISPPTTGRHKSRACDLYNLWPNRPLLVSRPSS